MADIIICTMYILLMLGHILITTAIVVSHISNVKRDRTMKKIYEIMKQLDDEQKNINNVPRGTNKKGK